MFRIAQYDSKEEGGWIWVVSILFASSGADAASLRAPDGTRVLRDGGLYRMEFLDPGITKRTTVRKDHRDPVGTALRESMQDACAYLGRLEAQCY